jgi:hypothetical protein
MNVFSPVQNANEDEISHREQCLSHSTLIIIDDCKSHLLLFQPTDHNHLHKLNVHMKNIFHSPPKKKMQNESEN